MNTLEELQFQAIATVREALEKAGVHQTFLNGVGTFPRGRITGPLAEGHYINLCIGLGFYVPEDDFQIAQEKANKTGCTQFLSVDSFGQAVHGSRDHCMEFGSGCIAWITPER